ncbi:MAG: N-acetylmuramic acid 6-phosphate etherase [Tenericutes bacterium GWC2_34_14]|nr:MAG: N-acetylmuramic acid 6-phosphate etherase [Tenericutes bacterium GWA2_35_7]OHE28761.1 MAG: N-acetylmuramic acid 6-phosphate etherase [Tenericutes bacterium GWC2_34_14]OHE33229.1 MAG: N-acetylmuramic acid 6-phosphate etherase [Tenericutes bacterium GWE2_34_108]OHE36379.1 MAG: N-acetylmuramic acid 6-phosphate etherase [Tenericutes bacterium GWF1_35_14]OHE37583.1 MAG: N-acetylmuramic acid 6-phosphate etherase [Tenericutes bacterium GWF2_35_184]OHE45140.1 MAG: N-acetylmuramic acid 6-phosph
MVDISKISTEKRNENTKNIDIASTKSILHMINNEDKTVAYAVEKAIDQITVVVDLVTDAFRIGGRLIYIGAGTSGRLGVLDASECPPTFGVPYDMVIGLIAGGDKALRTPIEGVEDSKEHAIKDLKKIHLSSKDVVIGIAASGRTPYVIGGIEFAKLVGAKTGCITTAMNSELARVADHPIEAITGAEPLTGSTRMKSGTAQKLILNMITTASMVKLGKVYENLMIDVQMSNNKLVSRATNIVMEVTGCTEEVAEAYLSKYNSVKYAIFGIMSKIEDKSKIKELLDEHNGNIRESLKNCRQI